MTFSSSQLFWVTFCLLWLFYFYLQGASQMAQWERIHLPMLKMQEMQVRSLSREDSPGGGDGNPLQYSCLEKSMNRGASWARAAKSQTQLSMHTLLPAHACTHLCEHPWPSVLSRPTCPLSLPSCCFVTAQIFSFP